MNSYRKWVPLLIVVFVGVPVVVIFLTSVDLIPANTSNDWIGFWGSYMGALVGALVAAWGIIKTIKESKKSEVAPYLIFEEVDKNNYPTEQVIIGHFFFFFGDTYIEKIVKITNVGKGPAKSIRIIGDSGWFTAIPVIKKDESKYVAMEYFVNLLPDKDGDGSYTEEEIMQYCGQSADIGIAVTCEDIMDNKSKYELQIKVQCSVNINTTSSEYECTPNLYLTGWKMKNN